MRGNISNRCSKEKNWIGLNFQFFFYAPGLEMEVVSVIEQYFNAVERGNTQTRLN